MREWMPKAQDHRVGMGWQELVEVKDNKDMFQVCYIILYNI